MSLLGNLTVGILGNMSGLSGSLNDSQTAVQKFAANVNDLGKSITSLGADLSLLVTGPLVALGGVSIKAASDFESAFAGVRKTVDATEAEMEGFRAGIRDMAKNMPQAATEIAKVAEAAGQLGIQNDAILGFTKTMVNMGVATNMSSEDAAMALARLATITNMNQQDFDRLGATIVGLGNNLAATESEIVEMGLRIAGAGNVVGMTEAQILGFSGALAAVGINAEAGGSAFSNLMIKIANEVAVGGKGLEGFAKAAGMSSAEFQEAFRDDAATAIVTFIEGLGKIDAAGGNVFETLSDLGLSEIRLRDALLRSAGAGDTMRNALELGSRAWEENSALTNEAAQRYETFESRIQIFKNRLQDIAITLGDALMPAFLSALEAAQPFIDMLEQAARWFTELYPSMQTTIITVAALAAALGPLLLVIGPIITSISALMPVLAAIVSPVGIVVAAIAGLTAGLVYLYKTNDEVRDKLDAAWAWIKNAAVVAFDAIKLAVQTVFDWIKAFWDRWGGEITAFFRSAWELVSSVFSAAIEIIRSYIQMVFGAIKEFWNKWGDDITAAFNIYLNFIKTLWSNIFKGIWDFIKFLFNEIKAFWDKWGGTIVQAFKDTFEILKIVWSNVFDGVFRAVKFVFGLIKEFWDTWGGTITVWFKTTFNNVKAIIEFVWDTIKIVIDTAIGVISNIIKLFLSILKGDWEGAWDAIEGVARSVWDGIKNLFGNVLETMKTIGKNIIQGLINGIGAMKDAVVNKAKDVAKSIGDGIKNFFGIASPSKLTTGYGENISEGLAVGIEKKSKKAEAAAKKAATATNKAFTEALKDTQYQFEMGNIDTSEYVAALEKVKETYAKTAEHIRKVDLEINSVQSSVAKTMQKDADQLYNDMVRNIDKIGSAITAALKRRYAEEEAAITASLQKQVEKHKEASAAIIDGYDKEYKAKIKTLDFETQQALKLLQDQIDGINGQTKAEEKELEEQAYQKKLAEKQKALAAATSADEIAKITTELNDMITERQRKMLLEQRTQQIDALRSEMDRIREQAAEKKEALQEELAAKKQHEQDKATAVETSLKEQMDATKTHFAELNSEEALQAEARRLAVDKNNKELVDLLKTYNPEWQNAGQSFGEKLLEGLNSTKQSIQSAVNEMLAMVGKVNVANESAYLNSLIQTGDAGQQRWAINQAKEYGLQVVNGVVQGVTAGTKQVVNAANSLAESLAEGIKDALQIKSPSRVMVAIGKFIGQGLAIGMEGQVNAVARAADEIADAADIEMWSANVPDASLPQYRQGSVIASAADELASREQPHITLRVPVYLDGKIVTEVVSEHQAGNTSLSYRLEGAT